MNKRVRNLIIIVVVIGGLIALGAVFGRRGNADPKVTTIALKRSSFVVKLPENGIVQRPRVVTVPTLVAGNLGEINVKPGDAVSAGEILATVENPTLESDAAGSRADYQSAVANIQTARINEQNARVGYVAAVQTAKSNLDEAQRVYNADVALYNGKAIPRNQLDTDRAKLDQMRVQYRQAVEQLRLGAVTGYGQNSVQYAQAAARKAQILNEQNQQQLAFERITAPFAGIVQTVATEPSDPLTQLRPGDPVTQGEALFTIAASSRYIVKAEVDEQDVINVRPGQPVNVTGEDFPGTIAGHVTTIAPDAIKSTDPSSTARQVLTTIALDRSPSFLRDGMTVNVDILTTDIRNVVGVPTAAIVKNGKRSFLWVVRGKRLAKIPVTLGPANDTQTVVKSGVTAGERVVAQPDPTLTAGETVKAVAASSSPAPAI